MNLNLPINLIILIINYPGHGGTTAAVSWSGTSAEIVRHGILKVGLGTATTADRSLLVLSMYILNASLLKVCCSAIFKQWKAYHIYFVLILSIRFPTD